MLTFSKFSFSFNQTLLCHEGRKAITFFGNRAKIKIFMALIEIFVKTGPYGAGDFKPLLILQFLSDQGQTL